MADEKPEFRYSDPEPEYLGGNPQARHQASSDEHREYGSIPPVLTREEWPVYSEHPNRIGLADMPGDETKAIALLNATLPADDRRKFGWDYVDKLREIAQRIWDNPAGAPLTAMADGLALNSLADLIASYLPPRNLTEGSPSSDPERTTHGG